MSESVTCPIDILKCQFWACRINALVGYMPVLSCSGALGIKPVTNGKTWVNVARNAYCITESILFYLLKSFFWEKRTCCFERVFVYGYRWIQYAFLLSISNLGKFFFLFLSICIYLRLLKSSLLVFGCLTKSYTRKVIQPSLIKEKEYLSYTCFNVMFIRIDLCAIVAYLHCLAYGHSSPFYFVSMHVCVCFVLFF